MLVGLDGTVGGSVWRAAVNVIANRAARVSSAMNEPISISKFQSGTPAGDQIDRAASTASAAARAIAAQIAKVGRAAHAGSIANAEYGQPEVQEQLRSLESFGFVNQLCRAYDRRSAGRSRYFRGPTTLGLQDPEIVERAARHVRTHRRPQEELIVAGYSRGGLNAINLCDRVLKNGGEVELLVLFDPVERDVALGACNISAGVRNCVLVQRGGNWITWRPYQRQVKMAGLEMTVKDVWLNNSRWYFGRMVDPYDHAHLTRGNLLGGEFDATHAAFGGLPWTGDNPDYMSQAGDRQHAAEIAGFVNRNVHNLSGWHPGLSLLMPMPAR